MTTLAADRLRSEARLDAVALKPESCDVARGLDLPVPEIVVDYEGDAHVPAPDVLADLAAEKRLRVTTPVRADGYDPLGDDSALAALPSSASRVLVAGNPAYLSETEASRSVADRLRAARESDPEAWVGTENVERLALAVGGTQFELLSRTTERDVRALRAAGFEDDVALYAPTVISDDDDVILDAVGSYLARRRPVARALPAGSSTDADATGRAREILRSAAADYALVGSASDVGERVQSLKAAGVDTVVGYPARGLEFFLE